MIEHSIHLTPEWYGFHLNVLTIRFIWIQSAVKSVLMMFHQHHILGVEWGELGLQQQCHGVKENLHGKQLFGAVRSGTVKMNDGFANRR
jgi:hypothetical protein